MIDIREINGVPFVVTDADGKVLSTVCYQTGANLHLIGEGGAWRWVAFGFNADGLGVDGPVNQRWHSAADAFQAARSDHPGTWKDGRLNPVTGAWSYLRRETSSFAATGAARQTASVDMCTYRIGVPTYQRDKFLALLVHGGEASGLRVDIEVVDVSQAAVQSVRSRLDNPPVTATSMDDLADQAGPLVPTVARRPGLSPLAAQLAAAVATARSVWTAVHVWRQPGSTDLAVAEIWTRSAAVTSGGWVRHAPLPAARTVTMCDIEHAADEAGLTFPRSRVGRRRALWRSTAAPGCDDEYELAQEPEPGFALPLWRRR